MTNLAAKIVTGMALLIAAHCGPASAGMTLDRDKLIEAVNRQVAAHFITADKVAPVRKLLRAHRLNYSQNDPLQFAEAVTDDLFIASADKHLRLTYDPALFAALKHPRATTGQVGYGAAFAQSNFGVPEARLLSGNVGYLKLTSFRGGHAAQQRVDAAFALLQSADGLILDLRGNGGGDPEFVRYIQGYFFDRPTLVMRFEDPGKDGMEDSYTRQPQGPKRKSGPLVVLVDSKTASAAEDFAYSVQAFGLGQVMGETSAGAAHTVSRYPIGEGFVLSVPTGRPVHPRTNDNWEGVGVTPDIAAPPEEALARAQSVALQALIDNDALAGQRSYYAWALLAVQAELAPPALPFSDYLALTGSYGFGTVTYTNDVLSFTPLGGTPRTLTPLTRDDFVVQGIESYRFHFDFSGTRPVLERVFPDGRKDRFEFLHR